MAKRFKRKKAVSGKVEAISASTDPVIQRTLPGLGPDWLWGLVLILAVFLIYQPVTYAGYIWDDNDHVWNNPCIIGPLGLKEIWTTSAAKYYPLVLTTFWLEHALWGLAPMPYHLVNVLVHGLCAVVLWRVLRRLLIPGAWLGAALWALHPVQVETVAWITELKNTQSCLFYLLSILFFVKWLKARSSQEQTGNGWNYALTLVFAALAMVSKSSTVVLPLVLCLTAYWVEGRWRWRTVVNVGPVFLMSLASAILAMWSVELYGDVHDPHWVRTWPERLITAGNVFWFYLGKLAWPHPLIFIYPRWVISAGRWTSYLPLLAATVLLFFVWLKRDSWFRPYFFALSYFLAALLPVLGLVEHFFLRYSFVADHLQYLASMGPLALAGAGLTRLFNWAIPGRSLVQSGICAGLLLILGLLSWQRAWVYESEETLWTDTLAQNPNCWLAHNDLGNLLLQNGRVYEAMVHFQRSLEIEPNNTDAHNNLGTAFLQNGQVNEAIAQYQEALEINPDLANTHYDLANILIQKGQIDDAIVHYQKALGIDPTLAEAHNNLGWALVQKGRIHDAIAHYQAALRLKPAYSDAQNNLAKAQAMIRQAPSSY